jgi:dihydroorotate dehydrogenase (fumarate)
MNDPLETRYLGLPLSSPLVAAASPATGNLDTLRALEEAGIAAVVLPSLFEEQLRHDEEQADHLAELGTDSFAEALDYLPTLQPYNTGPGGYLKKIELAKATLRVPVIGSLNASTTGGWTRFARQIEEAGADALELNVYFLCDDPTVPGNEVERRYVDLVAAVRQEISIPLSVKVGPYFSSPGHVLRQLEGAGADGLVLFNRYVHPDIDLDTLEVVPHMVLSSSWESRLALRWIALLRGKLGVSIAATGGVHSHEDLLRLLLVGADAVMVAAAVLQQGPAWVRTILERLRQWLAEHEYPSVKVLQGSMCVENCPDEEAFGRAQYMKTLTTFRSPYA